MKIQLLPHPNPNLLRVIDVTNEWNPINRGLMRSHAQVAMRFPDAVVCLPPPRPDNIGESYARVAEQFIAVLVEWLTPEQLSMVAVLNSVQDDVVCATHDFCDANVAMDEALCRVWGMDLSDLSRFFVSSSREFDGLADETVDLWNHAWKAAKTAIAVRFTPQTP
jgi:hypothetical protein